MSEQPTVPGAEWMEKAVRLLVQTPLPTSEEAQRVIALLPVMNPTLLRDAQRVALALESEASARASAEKELDTYREAVQTVSRAREASLRIMAEEIAEITRQREEWAHVVKLLEDSIDRLIQQREKSKAESSALAQKAQEAEKKLSWWEHADRADTARLCVDAEGNPSLTFFGPGEPGTRPYFAVSIEPEPDEGGAWGAFLRYGGREGAPNVGEFKTFPELRAALLEAIEADRVARSARALPSAPHAEVQIGGEHMERSIGDFRRSCGLLIEAEQEKASLDNALIGVLCDAVRLTREMEARHYAGIPAAPPATPETPALRRAEIPDSTCVCGNTLALGIVHRKDGPCWYPAEDQVPATAVAEPEKEKA